ncbi:MAG: family 20 glycosylhydrolase [Pseudomonadales bacterium]|nr:family 20 glycosylhydrolase [Pseudomonadales bacterium]
MHRFVTCDWLNANRPDMLLNIMPVALYPPPKYFRQTRKWLKVGSPQVQLSFIPSDTLLTALHNFCDANELEITRESKAPLISIRRVKCAPQSYEINCNKSGITLSAGDDAGVFYGLCSFQQILQQSRHRIHHFKIKDAPDFEQRGVMLDISRCKVPTLETLFTLIDNLAALKINQLQLYIEHTFAFSNHPLVWADASPLTTKDLHRIKQYCHERFIDLVPNFNSFGHFERWLKHPEYHRFAECPDGFVHPLTNQTIVFGSTLKPNQTSLRLIKSLYDEYLPLFDSPYFNIGGDEPWELGTGWSHARCKKDGTANVYLSHMSKIKDLVNKHGRRTMFWADIVLKYPESLAMLSKDLTAMIWGYEANHPFRAECRQLAETGVPFYVCPGTSSWNSLTGRIENAKKNLRSAAYQGLNNGATGYLITDWGDHGHHQYLPISYPGLATGACHAWHSKASTSLNIDKLLTGTFLKGQPEAAKLLTRLGKLPELTDTKIRNGTIFNQLLFWDMQSESLESQRLGQQDLNKCIKQFDTLQDAVRNAPSGLVYAELENAINMAHHGLQRLLLHRRVITRTGPAQRTLNGIIDRHRELWRARNRPGGLEESTQHLTQALKPLS